ncbi:MAG: hypothetical protein WH035_06035 [Spirochaetota bacterium]|nr:hypothetical protein [Exilispira sp.]
MSRKKNKYINLTFKKRGEISIKISDDIDIEEFEYSVISLIAIIRNKLENSASQLDDLSPFLNILIRLLDEFEFPKKKSIDIYDKTELTEQQKNMAESFKQQFTLKYSDFFK